jgi:tripartite-type tricarboxylate transporter receptor subunit TctC
MLGTASTFAVAPGLYKRLAYDPTKDFAPIMLVATVPFVLVVNPSLGVGSVQELVALAKSRPGELTYASAGVGAVHHIFCELFMSMTGIEMKHVPYRGGGQAINDVVAGHVPVYFADVGPAAPLIAAGKLKALGVTTATRTGNLPDVPTLNEAGVTGYEANTWQMMVGPARMPEPIVTRLNTALADFMRTPEAQRHFISLGMQPMTGTPAQASDHIRKEAARWTKIIRGIGVSVD